MIRPTTNEVLHAVLDDAAGGATLIECAAALAHALRRSLELVHVENLVALHAAALPRTRALAHAGANWEAFAPEDVERGWRAQAARLRALAGDIAPRHAVTWSLRSVRGRWPRTAMELTEDVDLLFVGALPGVMDSNGAPGLRMSAASGSRRPSAVDLRSVVLLDDGSEAAERAQPFASELSRTLHAPLQVWRLDADSDAAIRQRLRNATVCVLPRMLATPARLAQATCPLLLVA